MPVDDGNYEKEIISKHPDLHLAHLRYLVLHPDLAKDRKEANLAELQKVCLDSARKTGCRRSLNLIWLLCTKFCVKN